MLHPGAFHASRWWVLRFIQVVQLHFFCVSFIFFSSIQVVQLQLSLRYIKVLFIHPGGSVAPLFALHQGAFQPSRWFQLHISLRYIQVFFIHPRGSDAALFALHPGAFIRPSIGFYVHPGAFHPSIHRVLCYIQVLFIPESCNFHFIHPSMLFIPEPM